MIKFVILEDEIEFQNEIINVIDKVLFKTNLDYLIEKYAHYDNNLKKTISDCAIRKVYILDIELKNSVSGLDVANEIRKNDWDSEIIFVTNHDSMFESVHRTVLKVFNFIEKFHDLNKRLEKDIRMIINQKEDYQTFTFTDNKIKMQVYLKEITHIYRDTHERKLIIVTNNNSFLVNMTMANILKKLDSRFKQIHRACIVNTNRVNKYNWINGYFVLDNGKKVNLCSKLFKENING